MPIKVLKNEGTELRLRIIGENHSTLQLFRSRLNDSKDVDYANYFQKHPDLDEPELYVRCVKGKKAEKVFRDLCSDINKELSNLSMSSFRNQEQSYNINIKVHKGRALIITTRYLEFYK